MRSLFILAVILICSSAVISQSQAESPTYKLLFKPDTSRIYIGGMDSLNLFLTSTPKVAFNLSNRSIESNGYRGADGVLYTMRIKVPDGNHAAITEVDWNTELEEIDPKIIFPPVKKK